LEFQAAFMCRRKVRVTLEKLPDGDGEIFREALARSGQETSSDAESSCPPPLRRRKKRGKYIIF